MNDLGGHLLGFGGQVGVEGGGFSGVMAEILLDEPEVDTGFQQVGGVGGRSVWTLAFLRRPLW